jgi:hypothetical protein
MEISAACIELHHTIMSFYYVLLIFCLDLMIFNFYYYRFIMYCFLFSNPLINYYRRHCSFLFLMPSMFRSEYLNYQNYIHSSSASLCFEICLFIIFCVGIALAPPFLFVQAINLRNRSNHRNLQTHNF